MGAVFRPTHNDGSNPALLQQLNPVRDVPDGRDEEALDAMLFKQVNMAGLPFRTVVAVADDDCAAVFQSVVFGAPRDGGVEGVVTVLDDQPDGGAVAGPVLAGTERRSTIEGP